MTLSLEAWVTDGERPALVAAASQLCEALGAASGETWQAQIRFRTSLAALGSEGLPDAIVVSLAPFVTWPDDVAGVERDLRAALGPLMALGLANTALMTVFRHAGRASELGERIRRLNLMACALSHDTGVGVIDLDASLAHYGARALECDWRLGGAIAGEAAGHVIAAGVLALGLDTAVPVDVQEKAIALHGGLSDLRARVAGRLQVRARAV